MGNTSGKNKPAEKKPKPKPRDKLRSSLPDARQPPSGGAILFTQNFDNKPNLEARVGLQDRPSLDPTPSKTVEFEENDIVFIRLFKSVAGSSVKKPCWAPARVDHVHSDRTYDVELFHPATFGTSKWHTRVPAADIRGQGADARSSVASSQVLGFSGARSSLPRQEFPRSSVESAPRGSARSARGLSLSPPSRKTDHLGIDHLHRPYPFRSASTGGLLKIDLPKDIPDRGLVICHRGLSTNTRDTLSPPVPRGSDLDLMVPDSIRKYRKRRAMSVPQCLARTVSPTRSGLGSAKSGLGQTPTSEGFHTPQSPHRTPNRGDPHYPNYATPTQDELRAALVKTPSQDELRAALVASFSPPAKRSRLGGGRIQKQGSNISQEDFEFTSQPHPFSREDYNSSLSDLRLRPSRLSDEQKRQEHIAALASRNSWHQGYHRSKGKSGIDMAEGPSTIPEDGTSNDETVQPSSARSSKARSSKARKSLLKRLPRLFSTKKLSGML